MKASTLLRAGLLGGMSLGLTACDGEKVEEQESSYAVGFAQPFPGGTKDRAAFPTNYQGVYRTADSSYSLCIGPAAVWTLKARKESYYHSPQELDSLRLLLRVDSTYQDLNGNLHHLRIVGRDSLHDSWLRCDTVFSMAGPSTGRLRKFQGRYYLSTRAENSEYWQVQRLEVAGRHLMWQTLGQDTLRLRALYTASVRIRREPGFSLFRLQPAPGQQMRRAGDYAGLWETAGEFERRR